MFVMDIVKRTISIIYLDANNLYHFAMSKFFPRSKFKLIDPKEFNLNKYTNNSSKGCSRS